MERKIMKMLDDMKIPVNYRGYYYWRELILYVAQNYKINKLSDIKMGELYELAAEWHNVTPVSIERNLRTCVENRNHYIKQYFNESNVTNKKFLILCVLKLKERN